MTEVHSCSYFCTRPGCVLAQRDALVSRYVNPLPSEVDDQPAPTRSERLAAAGITRRPSLQAMAMREALETIANDESSPRAMRIALEALGRDEE